MGGGEGCDWWAKWKEPPRVSGGRPGGVGEGSFQWDEGMWGPTGRGRESPGERTELLAALRKEPREEASSCGRKGTSSESLVKVQRANSVAISIETFWNFHRVGANLLKKKAGNGMCS